MITPSQKQDIEQATRIMKAAIRERYPDDDPGEVIIQVLKIARRLILTTDLEVDGEIIKMAFIEYGNTRHLRTPE